MPDNDMGNPKNITNKTFEEAAKASGKKPEDAKKNTLDLLEKNLSGKNQTSQTQRSSYIERWGDPARPPGGVSATGIEK
jgi:hypothetical protein